MASFPYAFGVTSTGRYPHDVLASGWQRAGRRTSTDLVLEVGLVLEDATSGFCGAVLRWERGLVVLEDRHGKQRTFLLGAGFWYEGNPVVLKAPLRARAVPTRTASGSVVGPAGRAKTALASRIYVEGRHDAELVEKIWGDDLRHVGVVVEYLGGIDDLPGIVADFAPSEGRRLGVLVDHLVLGSKESRIADRVRSGAGRGHVLVLGHPYVGHLAGGEAGQARTGKLAGGAADRRMEAWDLRRPGAAAQGSGRPGRSLEDDLGSGALLGRPGTPVAYPGRAADRLCHRRSSLRAVSSVQQVALHTVGQQPVSSVQQVALHTVGQQPVMKVAHGPGNVFDRHLRIASLLVQEVDAVSTGSHSWG